MLNIFQNNDSSFFGVDIGITGVKVVQLVSEKDKIILKNYFYLESEGGNRIEIDSKDGFNPVDQNIIDNMHIVVESSGMSHNNVIMSVPTFFAFSSILTLPDLPKAALNEAINFEARKYIPIPIDEVVFGWNVIADGVDGDTVTANAPEEIDDSQVGEGKKLTVGVEEYAQKINFSATNSSKKVKRVLLVAISKDVSAKYLQIANSFNLNLVALETESFSLARSLVRGKKGVYILIDIGHRMTNITVVEDGLVMESNNVPNVGGNSITKTISTGFGVNAKRAEVLKKEIGLIDPADGKMKDVLLPALSALVSRIKRYEANYTRNENKTIDGVILVGGSSAMPGLVDYFAGELLLPVEIGNPFQDIVYNDILQNKIKEIAPSFAVAVGLALRGFEKK